MPIASVFMPPAGDPAGPAGAPPPLRLSDLAPDEVEVMTPEPPSSEPLKLSTLAPDDVKPAAAPTTLGDRFTQHAKQSFMEGTLAGAVVGDVQRGKFAGDQVTQIERAIGDAGPDAAVAGNNFADGTPSPYAGLSIADLVTMRDKSAGVAATKGAEFAASDAKRRAEFNAMPDASGILEMGAAVLGQLAGGIPTPENLIPVGRGATAARTFAKGAAVNAGTATAVDPIVQAQNVELGRQKEYSPEQAATGALLAGAIGGTLNVAPELVGRLKSFIGARLNKAPDAVTPEDATPDMAADPEIAAVLKEFGATASTPESAAKMAERVDQRRAGEADAAQRPIDTDKEQLAAEREAIAAGDLDPAAAAAVNSRRAPVPDVIVPERTPDPGLAAGVELRGSPAQARAVVPVEPQPTRLTPEEVTRARADMDGGTANAATPPDKITVTEGGTAHVADQLTPDEVMRVVDALDLKPSQVRGMTPPAQRALLRAADEQVGRQAAADAAGPMRVTDTSGDGATSPPRAPQEPGPSTRSRGEFEDTARPVLGDDVAASGTSERPFRAESTDGASEVQARGFEDRARSQAAEARAASEEDLLRRWKARADAEERMRARTEDPGNQRQSQERAKYQGAKSENSFSNKAGAPDAEKRFATDEFGYVKSDKGGPVRYGDQKQAAKWILNQGHKISPDQIFEIANHPSGRGFTVRETGRTTTPPGGSKPGPETPGSGHPARPKDPLRLAPPKAPEASSTPTGDAPKGATQAAPEVEPSTVIRDIKSGAVKPSVKDVAAKYGMTEERAGAFLNELARRPDAPIAVHNRGAKRQAENGAILERNDDPAKFQFRKAMSSTAGDVREHESIAWAQDTFGVKLEDFDDVHAFFDEVGRRMKSAEDDAVIEASRQTDQELKDIAEQELYDRLEREGMQLEEPQTKGADDDVPFEGSNARSGEGDGRSGGEGTVDSPEPRPEAPQEARADSEAGRGPVDRTAAGEQSVIPGVERSARQAQQSRDDAGGLKGRKPQKAADEGLFDTESRKQTDIFDGGKLYSGGIGDPEVWKAVAKTLTGWAPKSVAAWRKSVSDFAADVRAMADGKGNGGNAAANLFRSIFYHADGEIRAIANRFDSPTLASVPDMIFAKAGRDGGQAISYDEAVATGINRKLTAFARALGDMVEDRAALDQIVKLVQNPRNIRPGSPIHDAAAKLGKLLKDELAYLKDAGVEIGEVAAGYFPRVVDELAVRKNPGGFIARATEAIRKTGVSTSDAREQAKAWLNHIVMGDHEGAATPLARLGGDIEANFTKGRVLGKSADAILADFYIRDPRVALTRYFTQSTRRAELARRFGDKWERWGELEDKITKEGAAEALPDLREYMRTVTGLNPPGVKPGTMRAAAWARVWSTIGLLEKATISSLGEIVMPAVRTGNLLDSLRAIKYAGEAALGTEGAKARRALAEDIGIVADRHMDSTINAARWSNDPTGVFQSKAQEKFFRRTGLEGWTSGTRAWSTEVGRVFVRRLAKDLEDAGSTIKSSSIYLRELGVPAGKEKDFAAFVLKHNDGWLEPKHMTGELGDAYRTALIRFADQTVLRPSASTRPRWASRPLAGLIFAIQSYSYAFQENVLNRIGRLAGQALSPSSDLAALDRVRMIAGPMSGMLALTAVQGLISTARDAALGDPNRKKEETTRDKTLKVMSRAGLFGAADPLVNAATGARYQRDVATSLAGPVIGRAASAADTAMKQVYGSSKTNTSERKIAQTVYDLIIEPGLNFALTAAPGGSIAAAAATQAAGAGVTREAFVSAVAGQKKEASRASRSHSRDMGGRENRR